MMRKYKHMYTKLVHRLLMKMPNNVFDFFSKILVKSETREWLAKERIKNYALFLMRNFEQECKRIAKKKRIMVIRKGLYGYAYLNTAYLNNMLRLIVYSLYRGYIPEIKVNSEVEGDYNNWDWYFTQPIDCSFFKDVTREECKSMDCEQMDSTLKPSLDMIWHEDSDDFKIWQFLHKTFLRLNKRTAEYIHEDHRRLEAEAMLGAVIRGTDYIATKPKNHAIQPGIDELIDALRTEWSTGQYSLVYVATEDKTFYEAIVAAFGADKVVTRQKQFYDDLYREQHAQVIGDITFNRENDNYLKGIEYLSTLYALAKCKSIIGGCSGGARFAVLMSSDDCKHRIFNCGLYK